MLKLFCLLSMASIALGTNPYSALEMEKAWKVSITFDFENLNFKANFEDWKKTFNKKYSTVEKELAAFKTFLTNWKWLNDWNINNKHRSFQLGMNQFSDMNSVQFKKYIHGNTDSCIKKRSVWERISMKEETPTGNAPTAIDWTDINGKSYVTPVKNQGQCGSCWAFSTTGSIESRSAIAQGKTGSDIQQLSEQELVDCSRSYGNMGCNGGLMDNAFKYVKAKGGLCSESDYPYTARDGRCKSDQCSQRYDAISGYTDVTADSEPSLVDAVANGPVSIAIEADQRAFQFYRSGILDGRCGDRLDHGVLVVGYGSDSGQDFWKVKNSWGSSWGEDGYIRICRNCQKNHGEGECGILMSASFPISSAKRNKKSFWDILGKFHF